MTGCSQWYVTNETVRNTTLITHRARRNSKEKKFIQFSSENQAFKLQPYRGRCKFGPHPKERFENRPLNIN